MTYNSDGKQELVGLVLVFEFLHCWLEEMDGV